MCDHSRNSTALAPPPQSENARPRMNVTRGMIATSEYGPVQNAAPARGVFGLPKHLMPVANDYQAERFGARLESRDRIIVALRLIAEQCSLDFMLLPPGHRGRGKLIAQQTRLEKLATKLHGCIQNPLLKENEEGTRGAICEMRCRSKVCPYCWLQRAIDIRTRMTAAVEALYNRKLITLTLRSNDQPLADQLLDLRYAFTRLRSSKLWKETIGKDEPGCGGVSVVEITMNTTTNRWHPHIHLVAGGSFVNQRTLSRTWARITSTDNARLAPSMNATDAEWRDWCEKTGASYVTDVRPAEAAESAEYLTKHFNLERYLSKETALDSFTNEQLAEWATEIHGAKFVSTFGQLRHVDLEALADAAEDSEQNSHYETLGRGCRELISLSLLYEMAHADEPDPLVIATLNSIKRERRTGITAETLANVRKIKAKRNAALHALAPLVNPQLPPEREVQSSFEQTWS